MLMSISAAMAWQILFSCCRSIGSIEGGVAVKTLIEVNIVLGGWLLNCICDGTACVTTRRRWKRDGDDDDEVTVVAQPTLKMGLEGEGQANDLQKRFPELSHEGAARL